MFLAVPFGFASMLNVNILFHLFIVRFEEIDNQGNSLS